MSRTAACCTTCCGTSQRPDFGNRLFPKKARSTAGPSLFVLMSRCSLMRDTSQKALNHVASLPAASSPGRYRTQGCGPHPSHSRHPIRGSLPCGSPRAQPRHGADLTARNARAQAVTVVFRPATGSQDGSRRQVRGWTLSMRHCPKAGSTSPEVAGSDRGHQDCAPFAWHCQGPRRTGQSGSRQRRTSRLRSGRGRTHLDGS